MHCVGKRSGLSVNQVVAMIVVGVFPLVSEKRKMQQAIAGGDHAGVWVIDVQRSVGAPAFVT